MANAVALADMETRQQLGTGMRPFGGEAFPVQVQLSSSAIAFSPDAGLLASGYENVPPTPDARDAAQDTANAGFLRVWQNPLVRWHQRACALAQRNLSKDEWLHYFGNAKYHRTCPEFPDGPGVGQK